MIALFFIFFLFFYYNRFLVYKMSFIRGFNRAVYQMNGYFFSFKLVNTYMIRLIFPKI